jgi:type IV pilus assembly protein PilV
MKTQKTTPFFHAHARAHASGFTLLEVLVTLVVFTVALLALLGLQTKALKVNQSALSRSIASQYACAMLDILRSDWQTARTNVYNTTLVKVDALASVNAVRGQWINQLKMALPNSKVQICRRKDARAEIPTVSQSLTDADACKVTPSGTEGWDHFVVRIDWEETPNTDDEPGAEKRAAFNSVKAVAYLPDLEN